MKTELSYRIALQLVEGVGDVLAKYLIGYCGSAEAVFKQSQKHLVKIPGIGPQTAKSITGFSSYNLVEEEIEFIQKHQVQTLFYLDEAYPARLKDHGDCPMLLYYKGQAELNTQKVIAVVGTRSATAYGKAFCEELAEALKQENCLVVSGLAHGTDTNMHRLCVRQHIPTVGVLGHGFGTMYPAGNRALAKDMLKAGGLLTEFPAATPANAENFPRRNRIVAGMCDALIVVESAETGGSLITADIADSYNKDIYVLPGRINDVYSRGCNRLIRQHKAHIITGVPELMDDLGWTKNTPTPVRTRHLLGKQEQSVLGCIEQNSMGIDGIAWQTKIPVSQLALILLDLEFKNYIQVLPGKVYMLK